MNATPPLTPGKLSSGLTPLLLLLVTAGAGAILHQLWKLHEAPPPAFHRTDNGKRLDPWRPLPGCITLAGADGRKVSWPVDAATEATCKSRPGLETKTLEGMNSGETGFAALLRAIAPLRTPVQATPAPSLSTVRIGEHRYTAGADIHLTLDAARQTQASRLLQCLSGHLDTCMDAGIAPDTWQHHHENAALAAGTLLVMDLKSGAIEVAASSFSPCKEASERGQPLPKGCPAPARAAMAREWKLANPALFADEMPGSLIKPILLLALLRSDLGPTLLRPGPAQEKLLEAIQKSETPDFLDHLFCRDLDYQGCSRLPGLLPAARDLGWNQAPANLLTLDILPTALHTPSGRILQTRADPQAPWREMALNYDPEGARRCAEQTEDKRWSKCRGEALANLTAELWGQGNARVSPVVVASMLARLGAAANGQAQIGAPHLIASVEGRIDGKETRSQLSAKYDTPAIAPAHAQFILTGMGRTHQPGGSAHSACLHAQDGKPDAAERCAGYLGIAGKTGTPVFNHDRLTHPERAQTCHTLRAQVAALPADRYSPLRAKLAQCDLAPLKWYAALVRDDPTQTEGPWSKVVVALAERNWRRDGHIDAAFDRGSNIAAELVFRYLAGLRATP